MSTFAGTVRPEEKEVGNLARNVSLVVVLGLMLLTAFDNKRYTDLKNDINHVESMVDDTNNWMI